MSETITIQPLDLARGGPRSGAGRPPGTVLTEPSTLVARLRAAMGGISQEKFAPLVGATERTVRSYEKKNIIPIKGPIREKLEALCRVHGVPVEESQS